MLLWVCRTVYITIAVSTAALCLYIEHNANHETDTDCLIGDKCWKLSVQKLRKCLSLLISVPETNFFFRSHGSIYSIHICDRNIRRHVTFVNQNEIIVYVINLINFQRAILIHYKKLVCFRNQRNRIWIMYQLF